MHQDFIGKNIRYCRKALGMSQEALAEAVEMNRGNIASYEKGAVKPGIRKLQAIAAFFRFDLVDFIDKELSQFVKPAEILRRQQANTSLGKPANGTAEPMTRSKQDWVNRYQKLQKIYEGFHSLHEYRQDEYKSMPREYQRMVFDYANLLTLLRELLDMTRAMLQQNGYRTPSSITSVNISNS